MKSYIFIIVVFCTFLVSCTKEQEVDNRVYIDTPENLIGSWNWLYSSGGFAGGVSTPASSGEVRRIEIGIDNKFRYYINDILKSESTFQIEKAKSILSQDTVLMLTNLLGGRQSINFKSADTLILAEECFDCYDHCYTRIK